MSNETWYNYLVPRLGKRLAGSVTTSDMANLHLSMRDRPYQANHLMAIAGSMYGFATRRGLVPHGTANPTIGVERFREQSRERYLSSDELGRLGEALRLAETTGLPWRSSTSGPKSKHLAKPEHRLTLLGPEAVLALRLLVLTGARLREILHLEWRHIDLERGLIFLPDSKTGRKTLVLSALAADLLRNAVHCGQYVVPGADPRKPRNDLKKPWQAVQRHAGLDGVRLHDLRHTFASVGAGASLGLPVVGKMLGHTQPATTARYAHLDADPLRRATDLIGAHLSQAMLGKGSQSYLPSLPVADLPEVRFQALDRHPTIISAPPQQQSKLIV